MRALTEFLLREALTLLLDDPTPRNVSQAMGPAYAQDMPLSLESQTEESESQAPIITASTPRVMMVKTTSSAQQRVVLIDRSFSIDAFIPHALEDELKAKHGYKSIGKLRGSVLRVDKYHFSNYERCYALDNATEKTPRSYSTQLARSGTPRLCLYVEALSVIDDSELAVNPAPDLLDQPAIAAQLQALPTSALEQRLLLRQGISPSASTVATAAPSPAKRFDDRNPLLDEDCEIPEDQERELDAQDGWGEPERAQDPTDSQLIAENGPVSSGDSQQLTVSSSAASHTVVSSSSAIESPQPPSGTVRLVVPETESQSQSQSQSYSPLHSQAVAEEASVPDSQEYHFQRENLTKAFVDCSDTDSEADESEADNQAASTNQPVSQKESQPVEPSSQVPFTQQPSLDESLALTDSSAMVAPSASQASASQPLGEFMGPVRLDRDEPMTQQADESQAHSQPMAPADAWQTQADDTSQAPIAPSDDDSDATPAEPDYGFASDDPEVISPNEVVEGPDSDGAHSESEEKRDHDTSQQDGQADHWMQHSQPKNASPPKPKRGEEAPPTAETSGSNSGSPASGLHVTQRRKRKRASTSTSESQLLSPQEPSAKASHSPRRPDPATPSATNARQVNTTRAASPPSRDMLAGSNPGNNDTNTDEAPSLLAASVNRAVWIGISSFNKKKNQTQSHQRLRPSQRYQHLLPPFDLEKIMQQIANKKN